MNRLVARVTDVRGSGDAGQLILLILVYAVIAGMLVTVVVNVSTVFLYRRSLVAAADGAALSAANQPDLASVYNGSGSTLPLSESGTAAAVRQYAGDAELADRFEGFEIAAVDTDGVVVTVTLRARVPLPFVNLISTRWAGGYPVDAVARARSPLTP